MSFEIIPSDELNKVLRKLKKKDLTRFTIIRKKIKQIASSNEEEIDHYKNLRDDLSEFKRVHIDKSFVLLFKVFKKEKKILFVKIKHHDKVYKR